MSKIFAAFAKRELRLPTTIFAYQIETKSGFLFFTLNFIRHTETLEIQCSAFKLMSKIYLDLNFGELATGFALLQLPKMPELRNRKINGFEPSDVDVATIPYR